MRWLKANLRTSLWALLGGPPAEPQEAATIIERVSVEDIRARMFALAASVGGESAEPVVRRIRFAGDVQALWFLRSELMALLAGQWGESVAQEEIDAVSSLFEEHLPGSLRSRPSPLRTSSRDADR